MWQSHKEVQRVTQIQRIKKKDPTRGSMEISQRKWHLSGGLKGGEGVHLEDVRLEDTLRWGTGWHPLESRNAGERKGRKVDWNQGTLQDICV